MLSEDILTAKISRSTVYITVMCLIMHDYVCSMDTKINYKNNLATITNTTLFAIVHTNIVNHLFHSSLLRFIILVYTSVAWGEPTSF